MIKLSELPYGVEIPIDGIIYQIPVFESRPIYRNSSDGSWPDYQLLTVIIKSRDGNTDKYNIKLIRLKMGNNKNVEIGDIYFTYDKERKSSAFYGVRVRSSFRNRGISNYMISRWIEVCMQNDIEKFYTIDRQRKPILIYQLKKISFELEDTSLYNNGHNIIVCKDNISGQKVFFFENDDDRETFANSTINNETHHIIIPEITDEYSPVDRMVLENPYFAMDLDYANQFSKETIAGFQDRLIKK